ncbi:MAG: tetratricopeptide repeat protein [Nitrososphaeraceae archaeon]
MAFFWWSDTSLSYRHMESEQRECQFCQSVQKHTYRLYEEKQKAYSAITTGTEKHITLICHGCLHENQLEKNYEQELLEKYQKEDIVREAYDLSELGKYKDAIKRYDKILKKDPSYVHAIYGKASCLVSLKQYDEAEPYIAELTRLYPDNHDVLEMQSILERKLSA